MDAKIGASVVLVHLPLPTPLDKQMIFVGSPIKKEITISKDYFIINGHYTWYVKKLFIAEKNETTLMDIKYTDNIPVRIIDLEIQPLMKKLEVFKIEFNENALDKFTLDRKKLVDLRKNINTLKKTVKNLEVHYNDLTKIKLV